MTEIRREGKKYIGLFNVLSIPLPDNIVNPFVAVLRALELYGITDVIFDKPVPTKRYSSDEIERIASRLGFEMYGFYVEESEYEKIKMSEVSISNIQSLPYIELSE
jgi:hypothetical protein